MFIVLFLVSCAAPVTSVPTKTLIPTPTSTQTQIPTITAAPTKYSTAFAEQKVEEYLHTNNNCSLPCFWGIIPGKTNLNDAIEFFQPFGIIPYHGRSGQNIQNQYDVSLYIISKNILSGASIFEANKKIVGIQVFGEGTFYDSSTFLKSSETFWQIWESYLPQSMIEQYGFPDRVWLDTYNIPELSDPEKPVGYSIWFFYDQKNFLIVYAGITTKAPRYEVCLGNKSPEKDAGNLSPRIELLINTNIYLEDFAIERGIDQKTSFYSETSPEISIDDFRKMLTDQNGCFDTPSERLPF